MSAYFTKTAICKVFCRHSIFRLTEEQHIFYVMWFWFAEIGKANIGKLDCFQEQQKPEIPVAPNMS